jgi:RNA polymerase sigma-70 factor (sigma-E family)
VAQERGREGVEPTGAPPDVFEAFYREHARSMVRLAHVLTAGSGAAEELVQEAFLQVHRRWSTIEHPAAYLRTTVVHGAASHLRRAALERAKGADHRSEAVDQPVDELRDAIAKLPHRQRAAIVLRYYEDLPEAEIAATLGCRVPAVKSLLHRALKELREVVDR